MAINNYKTGISIAILILVLLLFILTITLAYFNTKRSHERELAAERALLNFAPPPTENISPSQ